MNKKRYLHYKMYKDGKKWVFAGLTFFTFGAGVLGVSDSVHADSTNSSNNSIADTTETMKSADMSSNVVVLPQKTADTTEPAKTVTNNTEVNTSGETQTQSTATVKVDNNTQNTSAVDATNNQTQSDKATNNSGNQSISDDTQISNASNANGINKAQSESNVASYNSATHSNANVINGSTSESNVKNNKQIAPAPVTQRTNANVNTASPVKQPMSRTLKKTKDNRMRMGKNNIHRYHIRKVCNLTRNVQM
ncbi:KxYKxGKxW signal peptide domain-containing protein [Weissella bombi]